jgi:arsenate reductase
LSEGLLRGLGAGRFQAFSAGSHPKGVVNPFAVKVLSAHGHPTDGLRSKAWTEFSGAGAVEMDIVVTVCDAAAGEVCPYWPGTPLRAHWGIADPAGIEGSDEEKTAAFETAYRFLRQRIEALLAIPQDRLVTAEGHDALRRIGKLEGATEQALSA